MTQVTLHSSRKVLDSDETHDLLHWPILRRTNEDFLQQIYKFYTFNDGHSALMLMRDQITCYALGSNSNGCLGLGLATDKVCEPCEVVELRGKSVIQFAVGFNHVMALTAHGELWGWGGNWTGQLGIGEFSQNQTRPVMVLQNVTLVACGFVHTAALLRDGTVWCWGDNWYGQLGLGNRARQCQPVRVTQLAGHRVVHIDCANYNFVALTDQSRVFYWGRFGWFGHHTPPNLSEVSLPPRLTIATLAVIESNLLILSDSGSVHRFYFDDQSTFHYSPVELNGEPVVGMSRNYRYFFLKLQSGRVALVTDGLVTRTSLGSIADACLLYDNPLTPTVTTLDSNAITSSRQVNMSLFHHPSTSTNLFWVDRKVIYIQASRVLERWPQFIQYLQMNLSKVNYVKGTYAVWFTLLRFVHTGTLGAIEPWWVGELLSLAIESNTSGLRDLCLHLITFHMAANVGRELIESQYWSKVLQHLGTSLTPVNAAFYMQLAEMAGDVPLQNRIRQFRANQPPPSQQSLAAITNLCSHCCQTNPGISQQQQQQQQQQQIKPELGY